MSNTSQIIYDILKELDLLQYWDELSKHKLDDINNVNTNEVNETRFEQIFAALSTMDKNQIKYKLKINLDNQIEMESDSEPTSINESASLNTKTNENKPPTINNLTHSPNPNPNNIINNVENHNTNNITESGGNQWKQINSDNGRVAERIIDGRIEERNNEINMESPFKKSKNEDVTCVHHISYKAFGPNNFVPSYSKRYYVESTGEEFNNKVTQIDENVNNSSSAKSIGVMPYNQESGGSTGNIHNPAPNNRNFYHPYQNQHQRQYSHNRMNSEPTRPLFYGFQPPNMPPPPLPHPHNHNINQPHPLHRAHMSLFSPNSAITLNPPSSSQTDYHHFEENNFKMHPMQKQSHVTNICPVFEGSKAMENSPLHKYNLLDPPIFKYHSIRIPPRIPFLIRLDSLDEDRVNMIKNASIIFGRSDNRRKSTSLNLNEMLMNEVAFQLCLRDPLYLISRQKLIMESREIIRESGHRIQDDVNIIPFEEITSKTDKDPSHDCSTVDMIYNSTPHIDNNVLSNCSTQSNKAVTNSIKTLNISNDVKTISEVRDAPIIPVNNQNETDPFFIQDEPSSVQSRNLMAKYCYDDYDTIYYYKVNRKWPPNADSSRKAYLRRKSKKFKVIDNYLYSVSSFSERLRLWLRDVDAVMEHARRFHLKENGEHFTRNETISRMLRYCYSNDIAQGVTKFIQTCEVCIQKEWRENGGNENSIPVGLRMQNPLTNHQLLSPTSQSRDSSHNQLHNLTNKKNMSSLTTDDQYICYSSDNSTGNKGTSTCKNKSLDFEIINVPPKSLTGDGKRRRTKTNQNSASSTKNN